MKESWETGKIISNIHSINESAAERELRVLVSKLTELEVCKKQIKKNAKYYFPDITIDNKIIIEFYGDYWHANPNKFKKEDIVHHHITAEEIWQRDKKRINTLKELGYIVHIVW